MYLRQFCQNVAVLASAYSYCITASIVKSHLRWEIPTCDCFKLIGMFSHYFNGPSTMQHASKKKISTKCCIKKIFDIKWLCTSIANLLPKGIHASRPLGTKLNFSHITTPLLLHTFQAQPHITDRRSPNYRHPSKLSQPYPQIHRSQKNPCHPHH